MTKQILTQERLKELLRYDPETGVLRWIVSPVGTVATGSIAGTLNPNGYRYIRINNKKYLAHRLVFLYTEGAFPPDETDHINRNRSDNRWCNLRACTRRENQQNRSDNTSFVGVKWMKKDKRWSVYGPAIKGKQVYLGYFKTHLAACYARHVFNLEALKAL